MNNKTICFISAKGGSGKTVTSSAIGTFLAAIGFKILLVDTDAATNGMTLLFLEQLLGEKIKVELQDQKRNGLFDTEGNSKPTIIAINENLDFVPATFKMSNTEQVSRDQFTLNIACFLESDNKYDLIIMDAQAGVDEFARITAASARLNVIMSEYDPVSAQGTDRLKVLFGDIIDPSSTWILFNKVLPEFATAIGQGLAIARYLPPLPWDADVVRAFSRRDLAIEMDTPNIYTIAISEVVLALFSDRFGEATERWRKDIIYKTQEPLIIQLHILQDRIKRSVNKTRFYGLQFIFASLFAAVTWTNADSIFRLSDSPFIKVIITISTISIVIVAFGFSIWRLINHPALSAIGVETEQILLFKEKEKIESLIASNEAALRSINKAGIFSRSRRNPRVGEEVPPR